MEREIDRKLRRGYPDSNIIFEDTRRAVLYQNHGKTLDADLSDARDIPNLLNLFYEHTEPAIHEFEQAVEEFGKHRLGNRSALEWVVDQYRVTEDERSGIRSDPNREDDPQYIVRLVGQVVRVSVETVRIVRGLPEVF
ncbi:MAG: hypothetical protein LAQ30_03740 [Acidobacteriia bacterium]|nr:hypothetical protein [Terriglobia bacterium]